jgi:Uri superfamily endonuclease
MDSCGGETVAEGFGSSDCGCKTHFFRITQEAAESFLRTMPDVF